MRRDIGDPFSNACSSRERFKEEVQNVTPHLVPREKAQKWARQLRFIAMVNEGETIDDGDPAADSRAGDSPGSEEPGDDVAIPLISDESRADNRCPFPGAVCSLARRLIHGFKAFLCTRRETGSDVSPEIQSHNHQPVTHPDGQTNPVGSEGGEMGESQSYCNCSSMRRFPARPISKLSITKPGDLDDCNHYLAISYRWQKGNPSEPKYQVFTQRGCRESKAPKDVLDRAIAFAAFHNIHLIWIDQECIDQDDRGDKECGIQSMDLVYEQATHAVALLNTCIVKQTHLTALFKAIENETFNEADELFSAIEVLELLMNDDWHSRAWCFQEAAAAGPDMTLLIRHDLSLVVPSNAGASMRITGEIEITLDELSHAACCIAAWTHPMADPFVVRTLDTADHKQIETVSDKLLHAGPISFHENPDQRYACNAAQAMNLLVHRKHSRVPDALAIIANLCNYSIRLNTMALETVEKTANQSFSLAVCAYTLAIANGDLSLLFGAKLKLEREGKTSEAVFSWIPDLDTTLHGLPFCEEFGGQYFLKNQKINDDGLALSGTLWQVHRQVGLADVQKRYGSLWRMTSREAKGGLADSSSRQELAKDVFWAIICKFQSQNIPEVANTLWINLIKDDNHQPMADPSSAVLSESLVAEKRARMVDTAGHPDILGWVINAVMQKGCLWYARRVTDTSAADEPASCVFDCDGPGHILTPATDSVIASSPTSKSRRMPISWVVDRPGRMCDRSEILIGRDLVRGCWTEDEASLSCYVLV